MSKLPLDLSSRSDRIDLSKAVKGNVVMDVWLWWRRNRPKKRQIGGKIACVSAVMTANRGKQKKNRVDRRAYDYSFRHLHGS